MKKLLSTNKGTLLAYSLIMIVLTSLTLFLLFAGIYEVSAVLGISSVTTFVVLVISFLKSIIPLPISVSFDKTLRPFYRK